MVMVDSSSWIESLRKTGRQEVRDRVAALLTAGEAAWCNIVRLELWNGARGVAEKKALKELEADVRNLPIDDEVWERSIDLAIRARAAGMSVPVGDLIIMACARRHDVGLEHCDDHMRLLGAIA